MALQCLLTTVYNQKGTPEHRSHSAVLVHPPPDAGLDGIRVLCNGHFPAHEVEATLLQVMIHNLMVQPWKVLSVMVIYGLHTQK